MDRQDNEARNLDQVGTPEIETEEKEKTPYLNQITQILSNPVNMTEYVADKAISGIVTFGVFAAGNAIVSKVKEARELKSRVTPQD